MKYISVTKGNIAIVDDEDFELVNKHGWCISTRGYAQALIDNKGIRMHRFVLGLGYKDGTIVDHINRNKLDNRKCNLRLCSAKQSAANRKRRRDNHSGYKGVRWNVPAKKWQARIMHNGVSYHLGLFDVAIEAAKEYDKKAIELFGEYASINGI